MLYGTSNRELAWKRLSDHWDVIVVGGGITGAGILREAARLGLKVLLLEQGDFASGTSSRSSKLVHGGMRYLRNFQFGLTWESVKERDILLKEGPGLVDPLPFLYPTYENDKMPSWMMELGLYIYGWMAGHWRIHQMLDPLELQMMSPDLRGENLTGGMRFSDACTDDARLVLRVICEGVATGHAVAINYARVEALLRGEDGRVNGVAVRDRKTGWAYEARAAAVVNATGVWADRLRGEVGAEPCMRPLRGSHLVFAHHRLPLFQAVAFYHPDDGRSVFAIPWENVTLIGTTDLDHVQDLDQEPAISPEEIAYLMRLVRHYFPGLGLSENDVLATYSGVRPVVSYDREVDPSKESREHVLLNEDGLLTVTGGKLTTFRCIALDALKALRGQLPHMPPVDDHLSALDPVLEVDGFHGLTCEEAKRLAARYGSEFLDFARTQPTDDLAVINGLPIHWLEFRWAACHEAVHHLDDLLLRRVRLGLLAPGGGQAHLPRIRGLVQRELGWDDAHWANEVAEYLARWRSHYGTPAQVVRSDVDDAPPAQGRAA